MLRQVRLIFRIVNLFRVELQYASTKSDTSIFMVVCVVILAHLLM
jgi:hypothetical protein